MGKTYSGFTSNTAEKLVLDAGAFFVDFDIETDTFESAVTAGKLLGATRGGGQFSAIPAMRAIEIDGVKGAAKGLQTIDSWEVKINANVLEITAEGLATALTSSDVEANAIYEKITARNYIDLTDYIDNITWVGYLSGSDDPVVIQVFNALNSTGLTLQTQDANEAVINMEFMGHYDASDLDSPPFAIYYPKAEVTKGSISGIISDGAVVDNAIVTVIINNFAKSTTTNASGEYLLDGVQAGTYTVTASKGTDVGAVTGVIVVADVETENVNITIS